MNKIIGLGTSGMSPDLVVEIVAELEDLGLTCCYGALCAKPNCMEVVFTSGSGEFRMFSEFLYSVMYADVYYGTGIDLFINRVDKCI